MATNEEKIQQIIQHFVGSDQDLGARIQAAIDSAKSQPNPNPDHIIDQFTSDPNLKATIQTWIAKIKDGHSVNALVGFTLPDAQTVQESTENALAFKGAVQHILAS